MMWGPASPVPAPTGPLVVLAADHRARGVLTFERYADYLAALEAAMPACDGVLASVQPLADLVQRGAERSGKWTYLSLNRTGLAGSTFELEDRLVATVGQAKEAGYRGVKHMTRIDRRDPRTAAGLELLGQVLEDARRAGLSALVESVCWGDDGMARDADAVVYAAVIAHDMGAPLLKVPVPAAPPGEARREAVARVVEAVGVPVLFLGGPRDEPGREPILEEVRDVMAGGAAGLAVGRVVTQDPDPALMARLVADIVHDR